MIAERKPRSDKKLGMLNPEQTQKVWAWMSTAGLSYLVIKDLIKKEFGIDTSSRALSEWWEERATEEAQERILRATRVADNLGAKVSEKLPEITEALKAQLTQQAFEIGLAGGDPKIIDTLMGIVGGINKAELDRAKIGIDVRKLEQRIREYEEKNAAARAALEGIKNKGGLTEETIREIEATVRLL